MCEKCAAKHTVIVRALMNEMEVYWHFGQIIPLEDRQKLGRLVGELAIAPDRNRIREEIEELLREHEVQIIFRSKHKEMPFQGWVS